MEFLITWHSYVSYYMNLYIIPSYVCGFADWDGIALSSDIPGLSSRYSATLLSVRSFNNAFYISQYDNFDQNCSFCLHWADPKVMKNFRLRSKNKRLINSLFALDIKFREFEMVGRHTKKIISIKGKNQQTNKLVDMFKMKFKWICLVTLLFSFSVIFYEGLFHCWGKPWPRFITWFSPPTFRSQVLYINMHQFIFRSTPPKGRSNFYAFLFVWSHLT